MNKVSFLLAKTASFKKRDVCSDPSPIRSSLLFFKNYLINFKNKQLIKVNKKVNFYTVMNFCKISTFFLLFPVCLSWGQDQPTIITNETEATSVLGGWPPQSFGKGTGSETLKKIINGSKGETGLKISDTESKVSPILVAQNPTDTAKTIPNKPADAAVEKTLAPVPAKEPTPADAEPQKEIAPPPVPLPVADAKKMESLKPLPFLPELPAVNLPELPTPEDRVSLPVGMPQPPPDNRKRVKSQYTLGPGDTVTFSTYERSDLNRTVRIAPDGTVSYLQAIAVNATGLTVDELRDRMEEELQKYRRNFKLIVIPQTLQSKQYAVLGRVQNPGTFPIDRPVTILEGIARARGVEIGTIRGTSYQLADFEHSFVARGGRKLSVDFSKLYHEGDLSQNVFLQPDDYIYIASVLDREIYVLGAVNSPGRIKMPNPLTAASAIAVAGGFSNEAYKMKVIVIRGDLEAPEVQVVNVRDVVAGKALDIPIKNRDIIFVARRPFEILERVLDSAITTYVQTLTAEAMNQNYTPISL